MTLEQRFQQGDTVRVVRGEASGREGVIYDLIRANRPPWTRVDESGKREYLVHFHVERAPWETHWASEEALELVSRLPLPRFELGARVLIGPNAYWAQGGTATISPELGWRIGPRPLGPTRIYFVFFDQPHRDYDGDGPYSGGEFEEGELAEFED